MKTVVEIAQDVRAGRLKAATVMEGCLEEI
jgi:hypothetical protein